MAHHATESLQPSKISRNQSGTRNKPRSLEENNSALEGRSLAHDPLPWQLAQDKGYDKRLHPCDGGIRKSIEEVQSHIKD
jgi:hypothetical protein